MQKANYGTAKIPKGRGERGAFFGGWTIMNDRLMLGEKHGAGSEGTQATRCFGARSSAGSDGDSRQTRLGSCGGARKAS